VKILYQEPKNAIGLKPKFRNPEQDISLSQIVSKEYDGEELDIFG
jgi:hypothetical protein